MQFKNNFSPIKGTILCVGKNKSNGDRSFMGVPFKIDHIERPFVFVINQLNPLLHEALMVKE